MLLTFVCKHWRNITLSTPQIWAAYTLHFTPDTLNRFKTGSENSDEELYMLWNERSANAPLAVHLILAASVRYEDVKDLVLSLCFKHSQRLEILRVDGIPFITLEDSLSETRAEGNSRVYPLPSLRVLQIVLPTSASTDLDTLANQVRILQQIPTWFPGLREFKVQNAVHYPNFPRPQSGWEQFGRFTHMGFTHYMSFIMAEKPEAHRFDDLVELHLHHSGADKITHEALAWTPTGEHQRRRFRSGTVTLPQLEYLRFGVEGADLDLISTTLDPFDLPQLRKLKIHNYCMPAVTGTHKYILEDTSTDFTPLSQFLERSQGLEHIEIHHRDFLNGSFFTLPTIRNAAFTQVSATIAYDSPANAYESLAGPWKDAGFDVAIVIDRAVSDFELVGCLNAKIANVASTSFMNIDIRYIPTEETEWSVTRAISAIIHAEDFAVSEEERQVNFKVVLAENEAAGVGHNGSGLLTVPTAALGRKFLDAVRENPIKLSTRKLKFYRSSEKLVKHVVATLDKTPFVSPDIEEKHAKTLWALEDQLRVETIQFGTYFRPEYDPEKKKGRAFSVEWEKKYVAWLKFEYDHKLIRITLGDKMTERLGHTIAINFASIRKIGVGYDITPYVCFDTLQPPVLEFIELYRTLVGDKSDNMKYKWRVGSLTPAHEAVAPYATQLRIVLHHDERTDMIEKFVGMCETAGIGSPSMIARFRSGRKIEAIPMNFFSSRRIDKLRKDLRTLPWSAAFQMEALLRNGLLHTGLIEELLPRVRVLCEKHKQNGSVYVGELLRTYNQVLQNKNTAENQEHPSKVFEDVLKTFNPADSNLAAGNFRCCHVTFTPTRLHLEGPYPTQSNRIIREYPQFGDHFIRVDFRDEDRLQYRWDRTVDGTTFLRSRVGGALKGGFELAGRNFEFLAYSTSALREHAVWFISPFDYHKPRGEVVRVDGEFIRSDIGDFHGTPLLKQPSKYAARIAQAFTATDPSTVIHRNNWEEVDDLGEEPYLFTDGVGTISKDLAERIWEEMCKKRKSRGRVVPDAYQIRFLGYKGVVAVDREMDNVNKKRSSKEPPIHMRLRPSMRKFENMRKDKAEIEIAQAFHAPNVCYLNRPLIMLLEDLGTRKEGFLKLQEVAIAEAKTIDNGMDEFRAIMSGHNLGTPFRVQSLLQRLHGMDLDIKTDSRTASIDTPFLHLLRDVAIFDVLRDIKHSARIPIPDSYLLVGIADEGVAYRKAGYEDVFTLEEGQIYVQRVYAVGKPPDGVFCAFRDLVNVVVLPSVGDRSLASCLGGGDVDGDLFAVIKNDSLLPSEAADPASYESAGTYTLPDDRDSTVEDICDFIVEYINSDVLGLLSDRLLIIADQSKNCALRQVHGLRNPALVLIPIGQAVDYPKQGIPVDLDGGLPKTLIRCKPDWHAAEVVSPRETDYYKSTRALGYLFRNIQVDDITEEQKKLSPSNFKPLTDAISQRLMPFMRESIGLHASPTGRFSDIEPIFSRYLSELDYICVTHTLSNTPGAKLIEAEVVAGTIMAKCSQKRMRKDRIYRMRTHCEALVKDIQKELRGKEGSVDDTLEGLKRAWRAWEFSLKFSDRHGFNSFGLIALGAIFDGLDELGVTMPSNSKPYPM
ncbi:hypothetical protein EST38_g7238 [Candolleomyces aberdarensis]|uniref:RDRP core domain-containing protein n=1 Tax=Candolleomyces aberdarensis TaxID=2316362 RepID=A0A4Q2DIY7_9AGAR|nr:hypothetical protein EST38_g7238 [Candolleomyces aberdarensis]